MEKYFVENTHIKTSENNLSESFLIGKYYVGFLSYNFHGKILVKYTLTENICHRGKKKFINTFFRNRILLGNCFFKMFYRKHFFGKIFSPNCILRAKI